MSQKFYTVLTKIGEAKYANSTALKVPMRLTTLAVGDGGGATPAPTRDASRLVRELRRAPLNSLITDLNNPGQFIAEQIIPAEIGGWWIREMGIYDADGDLIAIGNCPDTYKPLLAEGSGRTQIIRMIMQFGSDALIELKIDPAVVLATRQYVDTGLKAHREEADPHPQYLTPAELALAMADKADKHNAVLTGAPVAPTPPQFGADTSLATAAFVQRALGSRSGYVTYTASRTLNASHVGGYVRFDVAAPATCTLPAPNSVPPGSSIIVQQAVSSAGALTITTASGTIGGPGVNGAGGITSLVMQAALVAQIEFVSDGASSWFACNGSYGASMASSGYQKLPSGLIIQWGIAGAMSANEIRAVTLPVSFPTGAKSVVLTADGATPTVRIAALGTSTFQIQNLGTAAQNAYWQAIGY